MMNENFHSDTLFCVLEFLSIRDGATVLSVCKAWNEMDRYEIVWKTLLTNFLKIKMNLLSLSSLSSDKVILAPKSRGSKKGINKYKGILDKLKKFYETQIEKEESVKKASFKKYMDGEEGEKSTAFGMRFKKLSESAVLMFYKLMMVGGLEEIKNEFDMKVIKYEPQGLLAQYFLDHVDKFTQNGRRNDSVYANEYWKQYSFEIADIAIDVYREYNSEQLTSFLERFKPVLNEKSLQNILNTYELQVEENGTDQFLEYLLEYVSVEENYCRETNPKLNFRTYINTNNMTLLKYLKKMINIIYRNRFLDIFKNCISAEGSIFHCLEYFKPRLFEEPIRLVDCLCVLLEIIEEKSIDYSYVEECNIFIQKEEKAIIDLLEQRGLIAKEDYKVIFHKFNYQQKISDLLPKIEKIDPYEVMENPERQTFNFIYSVFTSYSFYSINACLKPFFEIYPETIDLNIIAEKLGIGLNSFRDLINSYVTSHFLEYNQVEDLKESLDILVNYFTPTILDVSNIERVVNYFATTLLIPKRAYTGLTNISILEGFKYMLELVQYEGVSFEKYCKGIRNKYSPNLQPFKDFEGEERMVYLYNYCLTIIEEMPKFYAIPRDHDEIESI